jgi:hypothetical protein
VLGLLVHPALGQWTIGTSTQAEKNQDTGITFTPAAGAVSNPTTVTFSGAIAGSIYCSTQDGSTPATNLIGTACNNGSLGTTTSITTAVTVKVVSGKLGDMDSAVGSAAYTISSGITQPCSGSPCVDNFNTGYGVLLSANWTTTLGVFNSYGPNVYGLSGELSLAYYNAGTFTSNQGSCAEFTTSSSGSSIGYAVRVQGTSAYFWYNDGVSASVIFYYNGSSYTSIGAGTATAIVGDTYCLNAVGSTITLINTTTSTTLITDTDSTLTGGAPGLSGYENGGSTLAAWAGYNR